MSIKKIIISDLKAVKIPVETDTNSLLVFKHVLYSLFFYPNFACVFFYRLNHYLEKKRLPFRKILNAWRFYIFSNDISASATIGLGLRLVHVSDIVIGSDVVIGDYVNIFNGVTIGAKAINGDVRMPTVGNNVFVGSGAKIIGDIKIGNNVIIGALTYCSKSVPSNSVAYGVPMSIIKDQNIDNEPCWQYNWLK